MHSLRVALAHGCTKWKEVELVDCTCVELVEAEIDVSGSGLRQVVDGTREL